MNQFDKLKFNAEALFHAVKEDKKFFASIYNFAEKLESLFTIHFEEATQEEIQFLSQKIESFFNDYRSSGADFYIPPNQVARNDDTAKDIHRLSKEIGNLSIDEFNKLKPSKKQNKSKIKQKPKNICVFIGHGKSKLWARLQVFLQNELKLKTVFYESESRISESIVPILQKMLDESSFAVLVFTAEDQTGEGTKRARQNVVHEAGLFQGRLGFDKVILLVQRGTEDFTNIDGLQYIPFTGDNIEESFYELQRTLKEKNIINT